VGRPGGAEAAQGARQLAGRRRAGCGRLDGRQVREERLAGLAHGAGQGGELDLDVLGQQPGRAFQRHQGRQHRPPAAAKEELLGAVREGDRGARSPDDEPGDRLGEPGEHRQERTFGPAPGEVDAFHLDGQGIRQGVERARRGVAP
jgi:hypothetical protein